MIELENMLLIGSTGSNTGKTTLSCALLKKFGKANDIIAVKITTIAEKDGKCPRGGIGCGVCSSLEGNFDITQETNPNTQKDTSKLLAAGAEKVYWMRVLYEHLEEGLITLLEITGTDKPIICESNAVRNVVRPGLFLMTNRDGITKFKPSAKKLMPNVDELVTGSDKNIKNLLNRIFLQNGCWSIKFDATAIILAGGTSGRMECDKSLMPINGKPLIRHVYEQLAPCFDEVIISARELDKYAFLGTKVVKDKEIARGPLMGIASALEQSQNEINFVVACDVPDIDMQLVQDMMRYAKDNDVIVPVNSDGSIEPLFAIYKKSLVPVMERALSNGQNKIRVIYDKCKVYYYPLGNSKITNLNWPNDYDAYVNRP